MATTIDERFNLRGKIAVVIGGAGYLCSTLARAMSESDVKVAVLDINEKDPKFDTPSFPPVTYLRCDVTSKDDLLRCRDIILSRYGRVDVLLNGAGTNAPTPFLDISVDEIERIIGVNLVGTLYGCQVFGEVMIKQRSGSIINFAAVSMGPPLSKAFIYSIAKAGVANITQNLAREWAPFNVRVNALRPGFFPTEWSMKHFIDEERKANILAHTPMGRFGKPEELIGAVLWLASDAAGFVTGSIVNIDCDLYASARDAVEIVASKLVQGSVLLPQIKMRENARPCGNSWKLIRNCQSRAGFRMSMQARRSWSIETRSSSDDVARKIV